jgi:hypothetical protein
VSGPGAGDTQSPIGWVTSDTTIGNNVDAYLDRDNNNAADENGRPISSMRNRQHDRPAGRRDRRRHERWHSRTLQGGAASPSR